jgi:carbon-monoxide dehydrogenase medium subunit
MKTAAAGSILVARSLPAALDALAERGSEAAVFAGGTWIMRSPIRHEPLEAHYVAIAKIPELMAIRITSDTIEIGAAVTHAALAAALADLAEFDGLATAAGKSANPAVRSMATVGGNLATSAFAAADCAAALLCLDAHVELAHRSGCERMTLARYLGIRPTLAPDRLLARIIVPRQDRRTSHARLPLRKAGDYPVAIVSLAASCDMKGRIETVRVVVGSVEPAPRRWERLEAALLGQRMDPVRIAQLAADFSGDFIGRDGVDVPAWYRISVLPTLARRAAVASLERK